MGALEANLIPGTDTQGKLDLASPFLAPDGESVGYFHAGQLTRLSINSASAVAICAATTPFGASWGTDNTILFGQRTGIMRVSANGGTPELVIPAKEREQVYGPQMLPDGDSVLFSLTTAAGATRWDAAQIVVQSLSTGKRTTVLQGGSDARYVPTGHLVYASSDALFAIAFDVGRLEVSGRPVPVVKGVLRASNPALTSAAANYGISDRGTLTYVAAGRGFGFLRALTWVDRQGREEPLGAPLQRYLYPRLSPDGARVALDIAGENRDIWIWDRRRRTMTPLTFHPEIDGMPVWTPDGSRLVWASGRAGPLNVFWQAADGTGTVERLAESANNQVPSSFTRDRQLIFAEIAPAVGAPDLMTLALENNRRVTRLVQTSFAERNGVISPDSRWLAYESNESGRFEIWVRPFPAVDEGKWQVTTSGGRQPLWVRGGRELVYVAPDATLMGLSVDVVDGSASFAAGAPVKLVEGGRYFGGSESNNGRTYDVSADGERFLRIKLSSDDNTARTSIVIVENWFEELKRLVPPK
jgi:Tol biopolymer transport system component